jgi:hypothetical protein
MMFGCLIARTPSVAELAECQARLIRGLRFWVVASRSGRCPIAAAGTRLGSLRAGAHLHLLLEEIGAAWPDPFALSPPCGTRLSHDEALLTGMLELAGRGDRPRFDRLLSDLLPGGTRDRLFLSTSVLSRVLREQAG